MVLKAGAAARRRLGDSALCDLRPNYEAALSQYNRILEQKNRILKDRFENPALLEILPEYNTRLCQVGALLISYRARFYESLGKAASVYHGQFSGGAEDFTLNHKPLSAGRKAAWGQAQLQRKLHCSCSPTDEKHRERGGLEGPC